MLCLCLQPWVIHRRTAARHDPAADRPSPPAKQNRHQKAAVVANANRLDRKVRPRLAAGVDRRSRVHVLGLVDRASRGEVVAREAVVDMVMTAGQDRGVLNTLLDARATRSAH